MRRRKRTKLWARSKRQYPTARRAMLSLERAGVFASQLGRARHTGTYWVWERAQ